MSQFEQLSAQIEVLSQAFDAATNEIADDLQRLREQLAALLGSNRDGLTANEAEAIRVKLDRQFGAMRDRLVELGKDPENPVPGTAIPVPPVVEPVPFVPGPSAVPPAPHPSLDGKFSAPSQDIPTGEPKSGQSDPQE